MELNPNISPHQFAIPGMEHLSHPFAEPLSKGLMLNYQKQSTTHADFHNLTAYDPEATEADVNKPDAVGDGYRGNVEWRGKKALPGSPYPGHVEWAGNDGGPRGLAGAIFKSAHTFDFGQDTVPVHSPTRTGDGDRFAERTMPELSPANGDYGWRPPEGIHPFEAQAAEKHRAAVAKTQGTRVPKGQGHLFNSKLFSGGLNTEQRQRAARKDLGL